jgi:hypothetical protein
MHQKKIKEPFITDAGAYLEVVGKQSAWHKGGAQEVMGT